MSRAAEQAIITILRPDRLTWLHAPGPNTDMGNKMEAVMSKRMFLSLEMVQWFNPPPSLNPHESSLAEARIPPEPSNPCPLAVSLSGFFFFFSTDRKIKTDTIQRDTGHRLPQNKFSLPFKYANKTSVREVLI